MLRHTLNLSITTRFYKKKIYFDYARIKDAKKYNWNAQINQKRNKQRFSDFESIVFVRNCCNSILVNKSLIAIKTKNRWENDTSCSLNNWVVNMTAHTTHRNDGAIRCYWIFFLHSLRRCHLFCYYFIRIFPIRTHDAFACMSIQTYNGLVWSWLTWIEFIVKNSLRAFLTLLKCRHWLQLTVQNVWCFHKNQIKIDIS